MSAWPKPGCPEAAAPAPRPTNDGAGNIQGRYAMTKLIDLCRLAKHWGQSVTADAMMKPVLQTNVTTERLSRLWAAGRVREGTGDHFAFQSHLEQLHRDRDLGDAQHLQLAQGWVSNYLRFLWKSTGGSQPLTNFMQWAFVMQEGGGKDVKEVLLLVAGDGTNKIPWCTIKWDRSALKFKVEYLGDPSRLGVQMG
jgi:hypothetical protein